MTMIVKGFATKKALKEAAAKGDQFQIIDPALMPEWRPYGSMFEASTLPEGAQVVITNHPKRSWFASITKRGGKLVVE